MERTRERGRLHAAQASRTTSAIVVNDLEVNLRHLPRRIEELVRQALKLIEQNSRLQGAYDHLRSLRGIAAGSAVQLLGELLVLPGDMEVRQWVAHAGLDVRRYSSGRSVAERPRISKVGNKHIRRAL